MHARYERIGSNLAGAIVEDMAHRSRVPGFNGRPSRQTYSSIWAHGAWRYPLYARVATGRGDDGALGGSPASSRPWTATPAFICRQSSPPRNRWPLHAGLQSRASSADFQTRVVTEAPCMMPDYQPAVFNIVNPSGGEVVAGGGGQPKYHASRNIGEDLLHPVSTASARYPDGARRGIR